MTNHSLSHLDLLAKFLLRRRDTILANWSKRVEENCGPSELALLTRAEFYDHIPAVLNAFHAELRKPDGRENNAARHAATEHGAHRWQQGFDLSMLIRDWGDLHRELLREVELFSTHHPDVDRESMIIARDVLAQVIHEGIARSIAEYQRLQRVEAESRAGDIERMLVPSRAATQSHGDDLRAASRQLSGNLNVIQEAIDKLAAGSLDSTQVPILDRIRAASTELSAMLSSLRDLARLEANLDDRKIEPLDAAQLLRDAIETFQSDQDLGIEYAGPISLAVRGDRRQIQRIIRTIVLDLQQETSARNIIVRCEADLPRRWSIVIEVTGADASTDAAGHLAGEIERIAEEARANGSAPPPLQEQAADPEPISQSDSSPFSDDREHVANARPGVGLAIVRRLCELLDATFEINTHAKHGSTFRVILPREYQE